MSIENPELTAALATVPEIERTEKLRDDAKERLAKHRSGDVPDRARERVIDEAVSKYAAEGRWPADVASKATKAYADAQAWEAERLALKRAAEYTKELAYDTREAFTEEALRFLGTRLSAVLSDAREADEALNGARTAEDAIRAGGDAVGAWSRLQELVTDLSNVREAQWALLLPPLRAGQFAGSDEARRRLRQWRDAGHGEVQGFRPADVPEFALEALRSKRYTVDYLLWLARIRTGYVPTSVDEVQEEAEASVSRPVYTDDNQRVDMSPRVTPLPKPTPGDVYPHSQSAQLDFSKPRAKAPEPTGTPGDPVPPNYF